MSGISKWSAPRGTTISETADGEYVLASDYDALRAELDAANIAYRIRGDVITEKNAELAALRQLAAHKAGGV